MRTRRIYEKNHKLTKCVHPLIQTLHMYPSGDTAQVQAIIELIPHIL